MIVQKKLEEIKIVWLIKVVLFTYLYILLFYISPPWMYLLLISWFGSLFFQSSFLHRYASHEAYLFKDKEKQEKLAFILCMLLQGPSYLSMNGYGILHKLHHMHTDTEKDVHSPSHYKGEGVFMTIINISKMMWHTAIIYTHIVNGDNQFTVDGREYTITQKLRDSVPRWEPYDTFFGSWIVRILWALLYVVFYAYLGHVYNFSTGMCILALFMVLIHCGMGPIHGALINWYGHTFGTRNYDTNDTSRNIGFIFISIIVNFILMGEDLHNNHHKRQYSVNFAHKWWEFDVTHTVLWFIDLIGLINFKERAQLV